MATLSGELWHSVAQAGWVSGSIDAIGAVAEVRNTGRSEGGEVEQTVTAVEGRPCEERLAQRFLQDRREWSQRKDSIIR